MKEIRISEIRASAAAGTDNLILTGRPIVYNEPTSISDPEIGLDIFTEIIHVGALDRADIADTRLLYNHDSSRIPLARTPRTLQLTIDQAGLCMTAQLPNTEEARAVYTAVERGDLSGMSFAFVVPEGGDSWEVGIKTRTRHIFKIKKIYEISVVPYPAYSTTSVEARTALQAFNTTERKRSIIALNQLLAKEFD